MVLVRQTLVTDWQALRDIRLLALRDAPDAFASTYAREAAFGAAEWQQRATRDGSFLAFLPEVSPAGLAACYQTAPGTIELVGMFVRPRARGRGVGEALIDAVIGWARGKDATTVHLWVTETNKHARRRYERCGFTSTGERQPLHSNPALGEIGMTRSLDPVVKDLTTERSRVPARHTSTRPGLPGPHDGLRAVAHLELGEHVRHVVTHGLAGILALAARLPAAAGLELRAHPEQAHRPPPGEPPERLGGGRRDDPSL